MRATRAKLSEAIAAFDELESLALDLGPRWLNDATRWEGDDYLGPKFEAVRERVRVLRTPHPSTREE